MGWTTGEWWDGGDEFWVALASYGGAYLRLQDTCVAPFVLLGVY